jgi:photosystem II stability/assembly factor-like uncharacterized protein
MNAITTACFLRWLGGCALSIALLAAPVCGQSAYQNALKSLKFRSLGPAIMGGRVDDFAVVESDPRIIYVAAAAGGVLKSINGGSSWQPVFDDQDVGTIGDIAIAPSDPSIVWVGSGEPNNRQSSSWGKGVYKSMDGGQTWTYMGLTNTQSIGRVVVHPADPNIVYVAALGHLWGPNKERGVYKTTDGGATWTQVLFINEDTGVSDIAMDSQSPNILYAAAYERRRTAFGFNGGGPGSGLYRTTDGGAHWTKLTKGLPQIGEIGRCAVDVYRRNPNIVYALIENAHGGVFRSEDKGLTWTKASDTNPRPSYYSQIRIDPNNDHRIWVLGAPLYYSDDGGRTFREDRWQKIHSDFHAFWINPANSDHMIAGSDGGINITYDGGRTWEYDNNVPLGQFYEISFDMQKPYHVCGGLQDNYSWCGPSANLKTSGITNDDWYNIGGGDGFDTKIDPTEPEIVYTESQDGNLLRRDLRTGEARSLRPLEDNDKVPRYRFQWNSPVVLSSHDPKTLYYGGNFLFKSRDRGDSWERISPDLTTGVDRNKLLILGKLPDKDMLSRHDGVQNFPCATTVAESPVKDGVLWVGTDDGNLQVTRDDGKTWTNVVSNVPGLRKGAYVAKVEPSYREEGTAYVAFDNHRSDDFSVYLYVTGDFGKSWKAISKGIPESAGTVHVVREDPANPNLLFAGTEFGLFVSFDRGASWQSVKNGLPPVPVFDIQIHPREHDLIVGTHGRSIWIMDDITPLEKISDSVISADLDMFEPRPAVEYRVANMKGFTGQQEFIAPNPPYGVIVNYYLKAKPDGGTPLRITIADKAGKKIRELNGPAEAGVNRVNWDLRYDAPVRPQGPGGPGRRGSSAAQTGGVNPSEVAPVEGGTAEAGGAAGQGGGPGQGGGGGGGGFFGGGGRGPLVDPGEYAVSISEGGKTVSKPATVEQDPRVSMPPEVMAQRRQAITKLYGMMREADTTRRRVVALRTSLTGLTDGWKRPGVPQVPDSVKKQAEGLLTSVKEVMATFEVEREGPLGDAGPPLKWTPLPVNQKIGRLMNTIDSYTGPPTARQLADVEAASTELESGLAAAKKLTDEDLPRLNKAMAEAGVPYVTADAGAAAAGSR